MLERRRHANLTQKPLRTEHRAELWVEHFERDATTMLLVMRKEHGGHAAASDLAFDAVLPGE